MAVSYVVQPARFYIGEGLGCLGQPWPTLASIFLVIIWPVIFSVVSSVYGSQYRAQVLSCEVPLTRCCAVIAMKAFLQRRLQFNAHLKGNNSGLTTGRFLRLIALSTSDLLVSFPLALYFLYTFSRHLIPWTSFSDIHYQFNYIWRVSAAEWANQPTAETTVVLPLWLAPLNAVIFFAFFGLAEDALSDYVGWYVTIKEFACSWLRIKGGTLVYVYLKFSDGNAVDRYLLVLHTVQTSRCPLLDPKPSSPADAGMKMPKISIRGGTRSTKLHTMIPQV